MRQVPQQSIDIVTNSRSPAFGPWFKAYSSLLLRVTQFDFNDAIIRAFGKFLGAQKTSIWYATLRSGVNFVKPSQTIWLYEYVSLVV